MAFYNEVRITAITAIPTAPPTPRCQDRPYTPYNYNVVIIWRMDRLTFEWDQNKSTLNEKKHGISFDEARSVFADEAGRLIADPDHSEDEDRFVLLGMSVKLRILVVCHCYRRGDAIRIISARKADRAERKQYEAQRYA